MHLFGTSSKFWSSGRTNPFWEAIGLNYPHDHGRKFEGALERLMHKTGMFDRKGALVTDGFQGSGADWLARYKPYIEDGKTVEDRCKVLTTASGREIRARAVILASGAFKRRLDIPGEMELAGREYRWKPSVTPVNRATNFLRLSRFNAA